MTSIFKRFKPVIVIIGCILIIAVAFLLGWYVSNTYLTVGYVPSYYNDYSAGFTDEGITRDSSISSDTFNFSKSVESNTQSFSPISDVESNKLFANQKFTREVSMQIESKNFDSDNERIRDKVEEYDGYAEYSDTNAWSGQSRRQEYHLRIPVDSLDSFVEDMQEFVNIVHMAERLDNVTTDYLEAESRIESLNTEQTRLDELLAKAESVEDLLAIEDRLASIRYELDNLSRQKSYLSNQIDYATVNINLFEVSLYSDDSSFVDRCITEWEDNMYWLIESLTSVGVFTIGHIPTISVILLITGAIVLLIRVIKKRNNKIPK